MSDFLLALFMNCIAAVTSSIYEPKSTKGYIGWGVALVAIIVFVVFWLTP